MLRVLKEVGQVLVIVFGMNLTLWFVIQKDISFKKVYFDDYATLFLFLIMVFIGIIFIIIGKKYDEYDEDD